MFTTEPSRKAMLEPTIVAASVNRLRLCDRAESKAEVASMTPTSQGGRVDPTIGCSRRTVVTAECIRHLPLATNPWLRTNAIGAISQSYRAQLRRRPMAARVLPTGRGTRTRIVLAIRCRLPVRIFDHIAVGEGAARALPLFKC